jgi:hypothetical protein
MGMGMERERNASTAELAPRVAPVAAASDVAGARGESFGRSPTLAATLLMLQRTVGNARVNRLLQSGAVAPASRRTLHRFVGWEHQRLGDKGSAQTCTDPDPTKCAALPTVIEVAPGVKLTWGQVVALAGDEFATVEDFVRAATAAGPVGTGTDAERGRLRAAMLHDLGFRPASSGSIGIPAGIYDGGTAAKQAQETTFQDLALHNLDHFPDWGMAQKAWGRHHNWALDEALRAGWSGSAARLQKAYLYEAFGEHFLTDCFSAGHIRTPRTTIYDWYKKNFADRAIWGLEYWLLGQYISNPVIPPEQLQSLLKTFDQILTAGLAKFQDLFFTVVAGAVSGTIHDYEGDAGVLVTVNILGIQQQFTTYGDNSLPDAPGRDPSKTSGKAEQLAVTAIQAAKSDVDGAYALGQQLAATGVPLEDQEGWRQFYAKFGNSQQAVLNLVPHAVAGIAARWGGNTWQWGKFSRWMYDNVNAYANGKIGGLLPGLQKVIDDHLVDDNIAPDGQKPFNPHAAVTGQIKKFAVDPVGTIGEMILWSPLDPAVPGPKPTPPPQKPAVTK